MPSSKVAKRYAQGLLDFTKDTNQTVSVFAEMKDVVKIMNESRELNNFLNSPIIDAKKKIAVATEVFRSFSPSSKNMISLIIKQGRETSLKDIAQEFVYKVEDMEGVQRITLTTATQLSQQNIDDILKSTTLLDSSRKFDLKTLVESDLIGGYILRVGDQQIDTSVKTKLNQIKKEFQLN